MLGLFTSKTSKLGQAGFLIRSAFGVSLVACFIMVPFGINNFIQGRVAGGITGLLVAILFAANVMITWRGRYALFLSLFCITPALAIASITALITLQVVGSYWAYLCVFGIYYILPFHYAKHANSVFVLVVVLTAWFTLEQTIAIRFCMVLIGTSIFIFISSKEIMKTQAVLEKQANTDVLTGALNRGKLTQYLEDSILHCRKKSMLSTICLLDIDHFKTINDKYGHDAGDKVLISLANEITDMISAQDILFRIGGEEFLILMKNADLGSASQTAEAIREVITNLPLLKEQQVTVSIGVAEVKSEYDWREWMKTADENLYIAKNNGRNQVVF